MHRMTSRVLMGPMLCRDENYLSTSMAFIESIFITGMKFAMIPLEAFRRIGMWVGSYSHRRKLDMAVAAILPAIEQRLAEIAKHDKNDNMSSLCELNGLAWTIDIARLTPAELTPRRIALHMLHNLWAGSAAPGGLVTQMVFQVLMQPEYLPPLFAEAEQAVSKYGWSEKALNSLHLQDSFIREINRLYPTGSSTDCPFCS